MFEIVEIIGVFGFNECVHSIEERDNVVSAFIWILVDSIVFSEDRYFRSNTWHFIAIQEED